MTVGRDQYLGTPDEVLAWMARAQGAPRGDADAYMRGIAARIQERTDGTRIDLSSPLAFLHSLEDAGLLRIEERPEASAERRDPDDLLDDAILTFGDDVDPDDLDL